MIELEMRCDGRKSVRKYGLFPVHIGREVDCEICLPYGFVSRHHARIERVGDRLVLIDEGSRNGVVCDGKRLSPHEPAALSDGSEFRIKRLVVRVRLRDQTEFVASEADGDEKSTALYEDHEIDPEIVDRVSAAIDQCNARPSIVARSLSVVGGRLVSNKPRPASRPDHNERAASQIKEDTGRASGKPDAALPRPIPLVELRDVAMRHLPAAPTMTSPNIDALIDGLPGYVPVEMPSGVQPAVEIANERALDAAPLTSTDEITLDDIEWRPPQSPLVRLSSGVRAAVAWLLASLLRGLRRFLPSRSSRKNFA